MVGGSDQISKDLFIIVLAPTEEGREGKDEEITIANMNFATKY